MTRCFRSLGHDATGAVSRSACRTAILAVAPWLAAPLAMHAAAPHYTVVEAIPYGTDRSAQTLDLYLPDVTGRQPLALMIFSVGSGNKLPLVQWFAERGYPVLFVNVRRRAPYPQPVRDAFCALAWARARAASYGIGAQGLVALGHSGGAVLAAHLGTVDDPARYLQDCDYPVPGSEWLRAVVTIAGVFDYRTEEEFAPAHNSYTPRYFGGSRAERPAVWTEASPINWVDGSEPPFLIVHGSADLMVRPSHAERSAAILRTAGVEVEYDTVPGADHDTVLSSATFELVRRFLDRFLSSPGP